MVATQFDQFAACPRRFLIRPNCSLSWRNVVRFYIGIFVVSIGIAIAFALKGAWLILPFAGLEMLVLGVALYTVSYRSARWQEISITGDRIDIVDHACRPASRYSFQRAWARVIHEQAPIRGHASRLSIRSHGHSAEIGACLNEEEKRYLAQQLNRALHY